MTQVDFHILQDTSAEARWLYVCRLIEKAERLGHRILVVVDGESDAHELDDLLWSFKPESFIPHQLIGGDEEVNVEISFNGDIGQHQDVLVNLGSAIPEQFSRFERVVEIVIQEPKILENTREHYRFYKQRGYPITQHKR